MTPQRSIASGLIGLIVFGMIVGVITSWLPPSPKDIAKDSYSGTAPGYRAVLESLQALGVPAKRSEGMPSGLFRGNRRVLLLDPDYHRLEREKGYQDDMEAWVKEGGELLVVSRLFKDNTHSTRRHFHESEDEEAKLYRDTFLAHLGLEGLSVTGEESAEIAPDEKPFTFEHPDLMAETLRPYQVRATGTLAYLGDGIKELYLPASGPSYFTGDSTRKAQGSLEVAVEKDSWEPIVLDYSLGKGEVTIVAEKAPFTNVGIGKSDNAVLACMLGMGDGSREIMVDEFYHGLAIEGSFLAFIGMYPYGVIFLFILIATACWAWFSGVAFGPNVTEYAPSRRSILEYIEAMANLFWRGRKNAFVLQTCRDGFIADSRAELQLEFSTPERLVLARLLQFDQQRAEKLREVYLEIDAVLMAPGTVSRALLVQLQEKLESCRSPQKRHLHPGLPMSSRISTVAP